MFVSIVRHHRNTLHQCERIATQDDEENDRYFCIFFEPSGISVKIDKADTQIYIMNDEGKTISKYAWDGWAKSLLKTEAVRNKA